MPKAKKDKTPKPDVTEYERKSRKDAALADLLWALADLVRMGTRILHKEHFPEDTTVEEGTRE